MSLLSCWTASSNTRAVERRLMDAAPEVNIRYLRSNVKRNAYDRRRPGRQDAFHRARAADRVDFRMRRRFLVASDIFPLPERSARSERVEGRTILIHS